MNSGPAGGSGETWNQYRAVSGSNLIATDGTATSVAVTTNLTECRSRSTGGLVLLKHGLTDFNKSLSRTVTISGLPPGAFYNVWLASTANSGGTDTDVATVADLVCGDAYLIEGQSNAVANQTTDLTTDPFVRTFGTNNQRGRAVRTGNEYRIGSWGMPLALHLKSTYNMPICVINAAVGGTRIDQHMPNPVNRALLKVPSIHDTLIPMSQLVAELFQVPSPPLGCRHYWSLQRTRFRHLEDTPPSAGIGFRGECSLPAFRTLIFRTE